MVETAAIDAKRRLVLLRRDGTEHLVLLGANTELLVESGIDAGRRDVGRRRSAGGAQRRSGRMTRRLHKTAMIGGAAALGAVLLFALPAAPRASPSISATAAT